MMSNITFNSCIHLSLKTFIYDGIQMIHDVSRDELAIYKFLQQFYFHKSIVFLTFCGYYIVVMCKN